MEPGFEVAELFLKQLQLPLLIENDGVNLRHLPLQVREEQLQVRKSFRVAHGPFVMGR
jgi:hypothetical protein